MSRDLHDFAMLLAQGGTNIAQIIMKGQENRERAAYRIAQAQAAARREALAERRDRREEMKTGQYMRESESRIAKRQGAGTGGAAAPSEGLQRIGDLAATAGVGPPSENRTVVVAGQNSDTGTPMPPTESGGGDYGGGGGGFGSAADADYGMRRGGPVKAFNDGGPVYGTSGPGSGRGTRAARPPGYIPGMNKGGVVRRFEGGGDVDMPEFDYSNTMSVYDPKTGRTAIIPAIPYALPITDDPRQQQAARGARSALEGRRGYPRGDTSTYGTFGGEDGRANETSDYDETTQRSEAAAARDPNRSRRNWVPPFVNPAPPQDYPPVLGRQDQFVGEEARSDERDDAARTRDPGETGGWPERNGPPKAGGGGGGGARGNGGARPAGDQPWLPLADQRREKAYDPIRDAADPDNIHAVDRFGRARPVAAISAVPPTGKRELPPAYNPEGGSGLNPQGANSYGAGLSTGNAANDLAAHEAGVQYAAKMFHLTENGPQSERGYHALLSGHGAATPKEMEAIFKVVDPTGRMPMDVKITRSLDAVHAIGMQTGQPEKAAKTSFEIMQFANQMAKSHGQEAIKLLGKGDTQGALNHLMSGYNWLPNGWTANVDPSGKELVLEDGKGNIAMTYPINAQTINNFALGMTTGELGWDVMRTPLSPRSAPGGAPGGAPAGGPPPAPPGRQPWDEKPSAGPTVPIRSSAQPSAAPAGPAQTPAANAPVVETKPPTTQTAKPAPTSQGKPQPKSDEPKPDSEPAEGKPPQVKLDADGVPDVVYRRSEGVNDVERMVSEKYGRRIDEINRIYATLPKSERAAANRYVAALNKEIDTYRNDLMRRRHERDILESQNLQPRVPPDTTVQSINKGAEERFNWWRTAAGSKTKDAQQKEAADVVARSTLRILDTPEKRKPLVNIARNIRLRNHNLDNDQAADVVMMLTADSGQVSMLGRDLANNVVLRANVRGTPVVVHLPREDFNQLKHLRVRNAQERAATEAENKRKADEAKKREGDLGKGSGLVPNMTPSLFLPM